MNRGDTLTTTTALDWVRPELDAALWHARQAMVATATGPATDLLKDAAERLRLATGALRLLELSGLAQVIGTLAPALESVRDGATSAATAAPRILEGIDAIAARLEAMDLGEGEQAHLLAPAYLDLCAAAGIKGARAVDLFHVPARRRVLDMPAGMDPQALAITCRRDFQAALLSFLTGKKAGLETMRQALTVMEQGDPDPDRNLLWWVACGLVDAFVQDALVDDREAKKLFSRIDLLLRETGSGKTRHDGRLLSEMVHVLREASPKSERIGEIQQHWSLGHSVVVPESKAAESSRPKAAPLFTVDSPIQLLDEHNNPVSDQEMLATVAREMRENVTHIEQALEGFFANPGTTDPLALIAQWLNPLRGSLAFFGMDPARELLELCQRVLGHYNDPSFVPRGGEFELVAEAIGSLAFHLEHLQHDTNAALPRYTSLRARFEAWDAAITPSVTADTVPAAEVAEPTEATTTFLAGTVDGPDPELIAIFVEEAREVLAHIGGLLQQAPCTETLREVRRGFHTLKGGSRMLDMHAFGETSWVVESALNDWLARETAPGRTVLELVRVAHANHLAWIEQLVNSGSMTIAIEPLRALAAALTEPDAATNQLSSPVAAAAEEASVALESTIDLSTDPSAIEADVVAAIEPVAIEPVAIELAAIELAAIEPVAIEPVAIEPVAIEPAAIESAAESPLDSVTRFSNTLSNTGQTSARQLLAIYKQEAESHLLGLRSGLEAWQMDPWQPSEDFMRAAHTLASISRTTGQTPVAKVAGAVEEVITKLIEQPRLAPVGLMDDVALAIADIERMVHRIVAGETLASGPAPEFVDRLEAASAVLDAECETERDASESPSIYMANPEGVDSTVAFAAADEMAMPADAAIDESAITNTALTLTSLAERPDLEPAGTTATGTAALDTATSEDRRRIRDDLDTGMLPLFLEEAEDLVPQLLDSLRRWAARHWDGDAIREMQRILHTLKGSARMAGCLRLGELVHSMESDLGEALSSGQFTRESLSDLEARIDRIVDSIERLRQGDISDEAGITNASGSLKVVRTNITEEMPLPNEDWSRAQAQRTVFRLDSKALDELIGLAGEIGLGRVQLEKDATDFRRSIGEMFGDLQRMRQLLRDIEIQAESQLQTRIRQAEDVGHSFDPLELDRFTRFQELTRMMAESVNDIEARQQGLQQGLGSSEAAVQSMARANDDIQRRLLRVRLVRFQSITNRLYRVVRLAGRELGKPVHLEVRGGDIELDRGVLDRLAAPLEHLLRNAVVHGIEDPAARAMAHKREVGQLTIDVKHEDNDIALTLTDDGAGLDMAAIEARARSLGLISADRQLPPEEIANIIFQSGFSTAKQVDENAGRGVGLDVVRSEITGLGGRVGVESARGEGMRVRIHVPIAARVSDVLLVRAAGHELAIPVSVIQQVVQRGSEAMAQVRECGEVLWNDEPYRYRQLSQTLDAQNTPPVAKRSTQLVLLRSGGQRLAVEIDEIVGTRRVVVKQLGRQLASIGGLLGATVLASGAIVLVIDPVLMRVTEAPVDLSATIWQRTAEPLRSVVAAAPPRAEANTLVMVVDDSVTVRKVMERVLTREGYRVVLARDGLDALERLQDNTPDIMLVDIEMPRMDGYDLVKAVRTSATISGIPIIMISSRAADKHRNHALALGVNVYLGKPFREEILFEHMRELLADTRLAAAV